MEGCSAMVSILTLSTRVGSAASSGNVRVVGLLAVGHYCCGESGSSIGVCEACRGLVLGAEGAGGVLCVARLFGEVWCREGGVVGRVEVGVVTAPRLPR